MLIHYSRFLFYFFVFFAYGFLRLHCFIHFIKLKINIEMKACHVDVFRLACHYSLYRYSEQVTSPNDARGNKVTVIRYLHLSPCS